jgi:hypothetical protein
MKCKINAKTSENPVRFLVPLRSAQLLSRQLIHKQQAVGPSIPGHSLADIMGYGLYFLCGAGIWLSAHTERAH